MVKTLSAEAEQLLPPSKRSWMWLVRENGGEVVVVAGPFSPDAEDDINSALEAVILDEGLDEEDRFVVLNIGPEYTDANIIPDHILADALLATQSEGDGNADTPDVDFIPEEELIND